MARGSVQSDSYHGVRRKTSAPRNQLAGIKVELLPVMAAGPCAGRGPTRTLDSGDDTSLRVVAPTPHHRVCKRTGHGAASVVPAHRSCPSFLCTAFLHPWLLDSASLHPLASVSTQAPPFTPDGHVSFSRPTLAARSATKQETMRQLSGRYGPVDHPPPPKKNVLVVRSGNRARY